MQKAIMVEDFERPYLFLSPPQRGGEIHVNLVKLKSKITAKNNNSSPHKKESPTQSRAF
jgi:hypothetical protein